METARILDELGAPEEVLAWARSAPARWKDAWAQCPLPDGLLWLGGVNEMSLPHAVLAALECARLPFEGAGGEAELALECLDVIEDAFNDDTSLRDVFGLADELEQRAEAEPSTYRDLRGVRLERAFRAATWVARAAEALLSAHQRAYAQRAESARGTAALLGIGMSAALAFTKGTELRLVAARAADDPIQSELAYVVAAAAEGAAEAARALAHPHTSGDALRDAQLLCVEMIREVLGDPE